MEYKILGKKNDIALIITDEVVIKDIQSTIFVLSNKIAGEFLQKFINYCWRLLKLHQ